jgi:hypothetical protein
MRPADKTPRRKGDRPIALAALVVALLALALSTTGVADAIRRGLPGASTKPRAYGILRLDKKKKFPRSAIPKVRSARRADRIGSKRARDLIDRCDPDTVDFGTWCLANAPYGLKNEEIGKNDYFFATKTCVEQDGYLPTAAQLVGAASRVKLASIITDSQLTASIDLDPSDGLKDRREMSSTLVTTAAGSSAAGSQGVSEGSRGDPKQGEPDPVPLPANPSPETLQYVTVYDNGDKGGFAGSKPVSQPELFRCAFSKVQGRAAEEVG